ncbi:MAG: chromosomal replication initiator protein DnaA [Kiritimatiellae bacterium]|nr:chromosomal replication initiator protein DnaA [Kiritimatiellia bacterium]MDD3545005.1 chromosomal replication initiator protein DnaA [Kiritimatiellia bacterium]MDD4024416.1 chromosomal replication initiator protein DnaA [Kiritimatiellia bacterium]NLC32976.1 chromosomal replication initiator protein DnaA [Clostridiales bacterium]
MDYHDLWLKACDQLKGVLNGNVYARWIEIIQPQSLEGLSLTLSVDNEFCKNWIEDNYSAYILDALKASGAAGDISLAFTVKEHRDEHMPTEKPAVKFEPKPAARRRGKFNGNGSANPLNPIFTFENFVTGPSNSFAHAAALGVSQSPGRAYNPLFIYGQTGIGKTHLMQAVGHRVLNSPGMSVSYVCLETLLNEYVESLKTRTTMEFRNKYRSTDVLLVDDIQFLAGKDSLQEEFFHTFNVLYDAHKQIIMTSDMPPREMPGLEPRLVSRFEWGLVTEIESPDFETRLAILQYKHSLNKIRIPDDLLVFIADNIKSNVRSLEGALTRVVSFASLNNQISLNIDILRNLLKDLLSEERQKDLSFDDIQRMVADYFDLRMTDMSSKRRPRSVSAPRQIAMFLCRKLTRSSLPEIANSFGKTHATVVHACKTIQDRIQVEEDLRTSVREITRKLGRDPVSFQI